MQFLSRSSRQENGRGDEICCQPGSIFFAFSRCGNGAFTPGDLIEALYEGSYYTIKKEPDDPTVEERIAKADIIDSSAVLIQKKLFAFNIGWGIRLTGPLNSGNQARMMLKYCGPTLVRRDHKNWLWFCA